MNPNHNFAPSDASCFYSFSEELDKEVTLKTDRLRSYPLFFCVSDNAVQVAKHLPAGACTLNSESVSDFMRAGYVTGADTLVSGWQQVQAAEKVVINKTAGSIKKEKYWEFLPKNAQKQEETTEHQFCENINNALIASAKETLELAGSGQIVVPLSGGYDSRAILLALLKAGATNIITFTFGRPNSPEVRLSQRIANELNLPWRCVTYSRRLWKEIGKSAQFKEYLEFICSGVSVPNVQLFPALKELTESGYIEPDAMALPGHTGDFVSGGHIPEELMLPYTHVDQLDFLAQVIVKKHYKFSRNMKTEVPEKLRKQLHERFSTLVGKGYPVASLFEAWECSERQAKFIVNSNRYYEFFDLNWHMPLWQPDFVDQWIDVPYSLRKNKKLWINLVEQLWMDVTGSDKPLGDADVHLSPWQARWKQRLNYFFDNNHLPALVPFHRWLLAKLRLTDKPGGVFSYLTERMLKEYYVDTGKPRNKPKQ